MVMSLFISVFIVACNIVNSPTPTHTASAIPPVTLTLRQPRGPTTTPTTTSAPAVVRPSEPAPVVSLASSFALSTSLPIVVEPPTCYPNGASMTLCLGLARNPSAQHIARVVIQVDLSSAAVATTSVMTTIEQAIIPPNGTAPYHAIFDDEWHAECETSATAVQAELATDTDTLAPITIESERGEHYGRQYRVSAVLYNRGVDTATQLHAIVTLLGQDGSVVGYRVARVAERLSAGERMSIQVDVLPQGDSVPLSHLLYVEAQRGNS
jgi:hypothetical protein